MIDQQTGGLRITAANTAAQLVQLRQPKTFRMFDHDDAGLGYIDANLDNRCRNEQLGAAIAKGGHCGVTVIGFHLAMRQCNLLVGQGAHKAGMPVLGGGNVDLVRFLDQRTDPVGALAGGQRPPKPGNHLAKPVIRHHPGVDRQAASRLFIEAGMIKIAIGCHRQRARDRRCRHHDHINARAFLAEDDPLAHAKPVLLVNHGKAKIGKAHILGQQRMRSHNQRNLATGQPGGDLAALTASPTNTNANTSCSPTPLAKQQRRLPAKRCQQAVDRLMVLARQYLGRGQQRRLRAALDRPQHRHQRHQRLARPDIALQHPQHPCRAALILANFGNGPILRPCQAEGQGRAQRICQRARAGKAASGCAVAGTVADHRERQLVCQQFIKGKPRPGRVCRRQIGIALRVVGGYKRGIKARPVSVPDDCLRNPFRQNRHPVQRPGDRTAQHLGR